LPASASPACRPVSAEFHSPDPWFEIVVPYLLCEFKLFFITGFLGALTTFSTFSAEVVALLQRAEYGWAAGTASLHLFGSLLMTGLGIVTIHKLAQ
jgi:fluoride ion exporter CrcB/FEX